MRRRHASSSVSVAILRHLDLPTQPPALSPVRGPPQPDLPLDGEPPPDLDQTPAFDRGPRATHVAWGEGPAELEPLADPGFDQSQSWGA